MTLRVKMTRTHLHSEIDMFEPGERLAGIAVGSSLVTIAVIKEAPVGTRLMGAGIAEIPPPAEGQGEDSLPQRIAEAIKNALSQIKGPVKKVCTIISAPSLTVKNITLPAMPEAELRESVKWEMEQNITYPLAEASLDFLQSGETIRSGTKNLELEVVGVQKKDLDAHLALYQACQLSVASVSIPAFCLWNVFQKANQWKESDTIALLEISTNATRIMVFNNTILRFSREIFFGENTVFDALKNVHQLETDAARKALVEFGLKDNSVYYECLSQSLQQLTSEVDRSFGYYKAQFHIEKIDRLILYGGLTRLADFDRFFSEAVGIFAEMGNPFNGLLFETKAFENLPEFTPYFGLAIGAALTSGSAKRLNLLPWELRRKKALDPKKMLLRMTPLVLIAVMTGLYLQITREEKRLTKEKQEKEQIVKAWEEHISLQYKQNFLDEIRTSQESWLHILKGISDSIPEDVWLNSCELNAPNNRIQLAGVGQTNILVIEFVRKLEALPYFSRVQIQSTQEKEEEASPLVYFTITIEKK